ncbi:5-oxoprolinase subunit PxpA [Limnobacter sp.]|uniref:5-oxoprolinase subunit PxpA n=1 Tax=Limnobacter sp. TaxID=2003368 RepID=UPI0035182853
MLSNSILINADLGEGCEHDEALFALVDMANVACGGHAGDAQTMRRACQSAARHQVLAGAHPSYPDRAGFGRTRPEIALEKLESLLIDQISAFEDIAMAEGLQTRHFKPHGQLYNDAAQCTEVAQMLVHVARQFPHLAMVALAGSPQVVLSRAMGVAIIEEAFPDRGYTHEGWLAPRAQEGAVLDDPERVYRQALAIAQGKPIRALDGTKLILRAQTLCVHGDSPQALANARAVYKAVRGQAAKPCV